MNSYQEEQLQALRMLRARWDLVERIRGIPGSEIDKQLSEYLAFRKDLDLFFRRYFEASCSEKCYGSELSACCSRDGIITYWADHVINLLESGTSDLVRLESAVLNPKNPARCIYLVEQGCAWRLKPIICEMFLCPEAEQKVFELHPEAEKQLDTLKMRKKAFAWPDRPVLFELLERLHIEAGLDSPLMYMHKSPGLARMIRTRK